MIYLLENINTAIAKITECMARDPKRAERLLQDVAKWSDEAEREAYARGKAEADKLRATEPVADESGLLPCPFCGSKAFATYKTDDYDGMRKHSVHCHAQCGGKVHGQHSKEADAIAAWNSRAAVQSAPVSQKGPPTDEEIIDMAVEPLGIDCDRMPHGVVIFARALLSRFAVPQAGTPHFADAYEGAREDLAIWKRRALEAERDLRAARETSSRLVSELNAQNGPMHMGEPAPQASAAPKCLTCGDKHMIGSAAQMDGVPCPDCAEDSAKGAGDDREAFEAWATESKKLSTTRGTWGGYVFSDTARSWEAWQARAALAPQPVPYPRREDVTPEMRAGFERLFSEARKHNHGTLARNEQGAYRDLRVDADWIFYQRAWADALAAHKPDGGDAALLDWLREETCDLRCINVPTGGGDDEVRWQVVQHHMAKPYEREVGRSFTDDPRDAIRAAMAQQRQGEGGEGCA